MKLFIQIPCYNEEKTLPEVVRDLPRTVEGVDEVEYLVIDDGSTDRTVEVARELGIRHIVEHGTNRGLAASFRDGVAYALAHGADIVVNTDGDNQYFGGDIGLLCQPIVAGNADLVVGSRPIKAHKEFSPLKKLLQLFGSWTLRRISKTHVADAASGFRAFSRETCMRIFIHSRFSYCMETLIQAGNSGLRVTSVDIRVNPKTRESRLFRSIPQYIRKSGGTMLAMFILYRPSTFFTMLSLPFWLLSAAIGARAVYLAWCVEKGYIRDHLPSLFLLVVFAVIAVMLDVLAIIGGLMKAQRRITEELLFLQRRHMLDRGGET